MDGERFNGPRINNMAKANFPMQQSEEHTGIRDVWAHNMNEEFKTIRRLIRENYCYVAMDTEFPGVVAKPLGNFCNTSEFQYQVLRVNCDLLKLIQAGITLFNEHGQLPQGITTWQFNFKFCLAEDMHASDSIELLQNCGIQFQRHETEGIDPFAFSELLITSGLVLNEDVKWISFHSGYDFGYLYRILANKALPVEETEFFEMLKIYFPYVYDIKYLMKSCRTLKGGLQQVAEDLKVQRVGLQHQAGSDSLVTGLAFFKMKESFFEDNIDDNKYNGRLYGVAGNYGGEDESPLSEPNWNDPPRWTAPAPKDFAISETEIPKKSVESDSGEDVQAQQLFSQALKETLNFQQRQQLLDAIQKDSSGLIQFRDFQPSALHDLVEFNPVIAQEALLKLIASNIDISGYLSALVEMNMSVHSMEVVNGLTTNVKLPKDFLQLYISNCIKTCEKDQDIYVQNRLIRLLCVFLQYLIRNQMIDIQPNYVEVISFVVEFARIRDASALFRLVRNTEHEEPYLRQMIDQKMEDHLLLEQIKQPQSRKPNPGGT